MIGDTSIAIEKKLIREWWWKRGSKLYFGFLL